MLSTLKYIDETDPLSCQRCLLIHDLPRETKKKDLVNAFKKHLSETQFNIELGKPYMKDHEEKRRAYVNCQRLACVDQLMRDRPIYLRGKKLLVSRMVPKIHHYYAHLNACLAVQLITDEPYGPREMQLVQDGCENHLRHFGRIVAREWLVLDQCIIYQFQDDDAVNQIMLASHPSTIRRFQVHFSKTLRKPQDLSQSIRCTHLMDLPVDVTSRELASIFQVDPADILLRPANPLRQHIRSADGCTTLGEAWIKGTSHPAKTLRGLPIRTEVVKEPVQSSQCCLEFRQGLCRRLASECFYQHTLCSQPNSCESVECGYGHYFSLSRGFVTPKPHRFRLKWTNVPSTITRDELERRVGAKNASCLRSPPNLQKTNSVYLVDQTSVNFLRKLVSRCPDMQCQLETNEDFFDWDCLPDTPQSVSSSSNKGSVGFKPAPWYKPPNSVPSV